jgi:hypothetical protein
LEEEVNLESNYGTTFLLAVTHRKADSLFEELKRGGPPWGKDSPN